MSGSVYREFQVGTTTPVQVIEEGEVWGGCFITVETANIRFRYDGNGDPSASSGHPLATGGNIAFTKASGIRDLRLIAQSGTATVRITLER